MSTFPLGGDNAHVPRVLIMAALAIAVCMTARVALCAEPASQPATNPKIFYGHVITPDGKPAAAAKVMQLGVQETENHIASSATTDSDGNFQLPVIEGNPMVLVQAAGFGLTCGTVEESSPQERIEFQLKPATELHLTMVDPDAKPIAGLPVRIVMIRSGRTDEFGYVRPPRELRSEFTRTTDEKGQCVIPALPQDGQAYINVDDQRYAALTYQNAVTLSSTPSSDGGIIKLEKAASIAGRIIRADSGKPAADVPVYAYGVYQSSAEGSHAADKTDAEGNYHLKRLRSGPYAISLELQPDLAKQYTWETIDNVEAASGQKLQGQDFKLITGGVIRGKVIEKQTGKPIAQISIGAQQLPISTQTRDGITDADGTYLLRVPLGSYRVYLSNHPPEGFLQANPGEREVTVSADQPMTVDFEFPRDPTPGLKGHAADPNGKPLSGVVIEVERKNRDPSNNQITTDAQGNFTAGSVPTGSIVRARRGGWTTLQAIVVTNQNRENFALVLHKNMLASVSIRVQGADGTPIADAKINVMQQRQNFGMSVDQKITGPDGVALVKGLYPDAQYVVSIGAKGFGRNQANLKLEPGKQLVCPPLVLSKADSIAAGIVLDEKGEPVAGLNLAVGGRQSEFQTVQTDESGHFNCSNIVAGDTLNVYPRDGDYVTRSQQIKAGVSDAVIVVTKRTTRNY